MYCLTCGSELNLKSRDYCENCGDVAETCMCELCEAEIPVSVSNLHRCTPFAGIQPQDGQSSSNQGKADMEINFDDLQLLNRYYFLQDECKKLESEKKDLLKILLIRYSDSDFLLFGGKRVGKVITQEYSTLDRDTLRTNYPDVYTSCLTKEVTQRYIKRESRLI